MGPINEKNRILIISMDYKEKPGSDDYKALNDHLIKIDKGIIIELEVTTGYERVFYSGPIGIEEYMKGKCAMEVFMDYCSFEDEEVDYYFYENELWVHVIGTEKAYRFTEWEALVDKYLS